MLGKHRDGTVNEIDTRSSLLGFLVNDGTFRDIVAHVGNVDSHLVQLAIGYFPDGQGIVEVLGIAGVDCTSEDFPEILTLLQVLLRHLAADLVGGLLHLFRIAIGQTILRQDGMHLSVVVSRRTENVYHLSDHVLMTVIRPLDNAHHSLVVGFTSLQQPARYDDVAHEEIVLCHEKCHVILNEQSAHKSIFGTLQDLCHLCLLDMVATACQEGEPDTVPIESRERVTLRDKDRCAASVWNDGVLAVGFAHESALLFLNAHVQAIGRIGDTGKEIVPRHLFHDVYRQHLLRMGFQLQFPEYLLERERLSRIAPEESLDNLYHLVLCDAFSAFFLFCHSRFNV